MKESLKKLDVVMNEMGLFLNIAIQGVAGYMVLEELLTAIINNDCENLL